MPVINTGKTTRATNPDLINTELASCFMLSNSSGLCRYWHDGQAPDWNTTTGEPQTLQDADLSSSNDKDAPIIVIHLTPQATALASDCLDLLADLPSKYRAAPTPINTAITINPER